MGANILTINGCHNSSSYKEYIIDSVDDIKKLPKYGVYGSIEWSTDITINDPCAIGSVALLVDSAEGASSVYILAPSNEWKPL